MHPIPASRYRPTATTLAGLAVAALVSAVIPAAAGLAFLISLAARRPLVAVAARRWHWLSGRPAAPPSDRTLTGLTAAWGIGLLAAGAVQGVGALTGRLALTSPAGFAARALIALAAEAILTALTITWLHRSLGPSARRAAAQQPRPGRRPWPKCSAGRRPYDLGHAAVSLSVPEKSTTAAAAPATGARRGRTPRGRRRPGQSRQ